MLDVWGALLSVHPVRVEQQPSWPHRRKMRDHRMHQRARPNRVGDDVGSTCGVQIGAGGRHCVQAIDGFTTGFDIRSRDALNAITKLTSPHRPQR